MKRVRGEGSLLKIYGAKDPVTGEKKPLSENWFAQYYDFSGHQVRVSTGTSVKARAAVVLRDLLQERDKGLSTSVTSRKLTYADLRQGLLDDYETEEHKSSPVGLNELDEYFKFGPTNPGPLALNINKATSLAFARKRKEDGVGNATINRSLSCLRRMLNIAKEDSLLNSVPKIQTRPEPSARQGFIEREKFDELLSLLPTHLQPLIIFLYTSGTRLGEALQIVWSQVDLRQRVITLQGEQTKNSEPRIVPLHPHLLMLLQESECEKDADSRQTRVFSAVNLRVEWQRACVLAGLGTRETIKPEDGHQWFKYRGLRLHDLRRSAIRNFVRAGTTETVTMKISGHKTADVFRRYNITSVDDVQLAMQRLVKVERVGSESLVKVPQPLRLTTTAN